MAWSSHGERPPHETRRAFVFALAYVLGFVVAIYGFGDRAGDESTAAFLTLYVLQPVFGFVLARWWGFLLAGLPVAVAVAAGTPYETPVWLVMLVASPFLAGLILLGFLARVAYDGWAARSP